MQQPGQQPLETVTRPHPDPRTPVWRGEAMKPRLTSVRDDECVKSEEWIERKRNEIKRASLDSGPDSALT